MTNALILHSNHAERSDLENKIKQYCSSLTLSSILTPKNNYFKCLEEANPKLLFLEIENCPSCYDHIFRYSQQQKIEVILLASKKDYVFEASKYRISGYLLKPINPQTLRNTVDFVMQRIDENTAFANNKNTLPKILGIPTMDGYEFIEVENIIRCESYLKCTRVVTNLKSDIISSYNIGEFVKSLDRYNFFRPHQSHLINLNKVQKYLKEGTIIMKDNSSVPVARRKRNAFLSSIPHL